jgi:hypothetical protein
MRRLLIKILIVAFFITISSAAFNQNFRRHFIIAYDVSTPFQNAEKQDIEYKQALINLFQDKAVTGFNEANQNNLQIEKNNGIKFFDPAKDEISFFHFNVANSEFTELRSKAKKNDKNEIVSAFNNAFLKDKKFNWSAFFKKNNGNVDEYFNRALSIPSSPLDFGSGVSMSNFVYPLALEKIDTSKYAEEYILIILSDFLTGSMLGNTKDLDRVKDIFLVPYTASLPSNSPVNYIKEKVDFLSAQYYKIDFFQYSFIPNNVNNRIGIISYKVKPKIGVLTPEDVSIFVDADLNLNQKGYKSLEFKTSETEIKFTHNQYLVPTQLRMTIFSFNQGNSTILFDNVVAEKDEVGDWKSNYTEDKNLMNFDSSRLTYFLPTLKVDLDSSINNKKFDYLRVQFEFSTKYLVANSQPVNFLYKAERTLPIENIDYSTKATIIIMTIVLPILAIALLLIFLIVYGKPRRLFFPPLDGYLDSFEKVDYKTDGKLITPYKAWNYENQAGVDLILAKGFLQFKSAGFPFNWNSPVYLQLTAEKVPTGFELFLKHDIQDIKEFGVDTPTIIKKGKNGTLLFVVGIRQTDITKQLIEPELVKFSVEAVIKDSILFIKSELRDTIDYKFHIGADLRDVWVGFDPGTSGSCVAVGSSTDNIILGEDIRIRDIANPERRIIPSLLVFDKRKQFHANGADLPVTIYKHGNEANLFFGNINFQSFQSIKKLLGYKTQSEIVFDNKNTLSLKGKDLASLLVKGLIKDTNTYFNRPDFNADDYKRDGIFCPLRAVVAIPNNFTANKIQDMIDCISNLNQFKEIRYVYEAEAVLFHYLSNYRKLNTDETQPHSETILVFDMGGATINATVVTANKTLINDRPKYEIDFLGKIGYGIGGDTIDYCITRFILSFKDEFRALGEVDIFERKNVLANLAFEIKKEIIANYYSGKAYLITAYNLEAFINNALGVSITIDEEESEMYKYFLKSSRGKFKLFEHPLFINTIYNNVKDSIKEVVGLSNSTQIDKVIFSGRSTSFPMIKETVEEQLKAIDIHAKSIALSLEESKTAVAKGACWYGINKNFVRLNNLKTNASFGFKKTLSADQVDVKFFELVEMGRNFDDKNDGIDSFHGVYELEDDFASDGNKVNFYQVMGKDANKILSAGQKHKFNKIATIRVDLPTSKIAMRVNENDEVDCAVILNTNRKLEGKGVVADQEIDDANEEHYTWIVK